MSRWGRRNQPPPELELFTATHHPKLVGTLTLYCGDRDVAEELAQEALVRVCRDWEQVREMNAPGAWAHRVAINLANSHYRRNKAARRATTKVQADALEHHTDPESAHTVAVRRAIQDLKPKQRSVIVLRYYADLPLQDIADSLGSSLSAVKSLHHRATKALQIALADETVRIHDEEAANVG